MDLQTEPSRRSGGISQAWRAAVVWEVEFEYSGYVLGNYLDAQQAVNGVTLIDERSEVARVLSQVFTGAFPFDESISPPDLPRELLPAFCAEEYGGDSGGMSEAITAADSFYRRGLAEITPEHVVVFVIT